MEQEDENISLLLNMGFPDVRAIKRALKLSNGEVNEAVIYLTEQPLTSYSTVDDLRDVEMAETQGPPTYDEVGGAAEAWFGGGGVMGYECSSGVIFCVWSASLNSFILVWIGCS